jgi:GNAT superfamily N-acetyltransferase
LSATRDVAFTRAEAHDLPLLLEMMCEFYAYEHLVWDEPVARRGLDELLGDPALGQVWLIHAGDAVAGYFVLALSFSLEFHGRYGFLDELFLRAPFRGGGIGRLAVQKATDACRAIGARALRLEITATNAGARSFYQRLDFADAGRALLTRWITDPPAPSDAASNRIPSGELP